MRKNLRHSLATGHWPLAILFTILLFSVCRADVADRMLVIVNGYLITESDVIWALALDPELQPLDLGAETRRQMLERLIDQKLLLTEAARTPQNEPGEEEITAYQNDKLIRGGFGTEAKLRERLQQTGLDPATLREILRQRVAIEKYVDFRFRSFALVRSDEIEAHYRDVWAPRHQTPGAVAPPLDDNIRREIETVIINQKSNAELDRFFDEARENAQITRLAQL
ncbi:MAG: hypothetical protein ACKV2V_02545 [Blastocatellia bacterium]